MTDYYGKQAYNSQQIPRQPKAADRSWLSKQVYSHLPWGNTQPTAATNFGKSTIYDWLNEKSPRYDHTFPKPIKLSAKSIGWLSSEIETWLLSRVALTRATDLSEVELNIH